MNFIFSPEKQEVKKEYLSWEEFDTIINGLALKINEEYRPDIIIALQRGGFIPAVCLSHAMGVRDIKPLNVKRTASDEVNAEMIKPEVRYHELLSEINGKKVLIVDDIADHGETLKATQEVVRNNNPSEIRTVVLVTRRDHLDQVSEKPKIDYNGKDVYSWTVFPWDKKE